MKPKNFGLNLKIQATCQKILLIKLNLRLLMNRIKIVLIILLVLSSCKAKKQTKFRVSNIPKTNKLIELMNSSKFNCNWISAKISGKFINNNQNISFKGNIKIKNDSLIWLSLSPGLGLELGRVLFDQDSIHFMNRFEKKYYKISYESLSSMIEFNINFDEIQSIILGNPIMIFANKKFITEIIEDDFSLSSFNKKQRQKILKNKKKSDTDIFVTKINPITYRVINEKYQNLFYNKMLSIEYKDFEKINNNLLAESINLSIESETQIKLLISFSKVQINKKLSFPFNIPESYEVIN
tara:strand:+ start:11268 stop:12155 length:888 start_codon:yes stop_codon:yes gene_type:complete